MTSSINRFGTVPLIIAEKFALAVNAVSIPRLESTVFSLNFDSSLNFGKINSTVSCRMVRMAAEIFGQVKSLHAIQSLSLQLYDSAGRMSNIDVRTGELSRATYGTSTNCAFSVRDAPYLRLFVMPSHSAG